MPAAAPAEAEAHFAKKLSYETDCWDVHHALATGEDRVRASGYSAAPSCTRRGMWAGALSLPHGKIIAAKMRDWAAETLFVVYCAGLISNAAAPPRAAF